VSAVLYFDFCCHNYQFLFRIKKGGKGNLRFSKTEVLFMINKVEICGVNTGKLPILSAEEKQILIERIKQGDEEAREEYIYGNLRLVLSVIQRFASRGENMDDLFQVGCIGLIKAVDNFDLSQGVKFSTYAVPMIIGEVRRYLRDNNSVRVSRSLRDLAYKALSVKENYIKEHSKEPTVEEIAKVLGVEPSDISNAIGAIQDPVSLYEPIYTDSGDSVCGMDQIGDTKNTDESWLEHIAIGEAISKLSDREKHILNLRFYQGKTQLQVASEIGISQAQVSRLEKNAINQIKKSL